MDSRDSTPPGSFDGFGINSVARGGGRRSGDHDRSAVPATSSRAARYTFRSQSFSTDREGVMSHDATEHRSFTFGVFTADTDPDDKAAELRNVHIADF